MKNKFLKIAAMSMALMLAMPINAFATPISLANSTESVATDTLDKANGTDYFADETTNVWQDGSISEEVRVTVSKASEFEITIPKEVVLDGSTGTADYKVKAKGNIAGDQKIIVTPDASFTLSEAGGKADVTATVTQPNTEYVYTDLQGDGTEYDGNISAALSAGEWSGKFSFNIEFKTNSTHVHNADKEIQITKSWELVSGDFSQDGNTWTSTNKTDNSTGTATWTITLEQDVEINIPYNVSSEFKSDTFSIKLDNISVCSTLYGVKSDTYVTTLSKGTHTITATYKKDSEGSDGNDEGQLILNDVLYTVYGCTEDTHIHDYFSEITKEATSTDTGIITYNCNKCEHSYTEIIPIPFKFRSWTEIASISESGNAESIFNIGDEKELQIGSETYHVQILGFNHDDLSDGTGKAGITLGLKEIMTTTKAMNSSATNVGGWKDSEMRTYVNNDIYNNLPSDLQSVIKTVNKISDIGSGSSTLNITEDKLFLFSTTEIGDERNYSITNQGVKYKFFNIKNSTQKQYLNNTTVGNWWYRSCFAMTHDRFFNSSGMDLANENCGVVFGFCI